MLQRRTMFRTALAGLLGGIILVGAAWAGVVATPSDDLTDELPDGLADPLGSVEGVIEGSAALGGTATGSAAGAPVQPVGLLAGAAKASIAPRPTTTAARGRPTPTPAARSTPPSSSTWAPPPRTLSHLADTGSPWPENPNCIYQGGFGIGPMNPVSAFDDELGLWVRADRHRRRHRHDRPDDHRRRGLAVGLRHQVRGLRRQAADHPSWRRARHRPGGHRHRRHPQPRLA